MNDKQHSFALKLAYEHVRLMAAQAKSFAADELTQQALQDATDMFHKIALTVSLNADERELMLALIDMTIEATDTTKEDRQLAFEISNLI